MRKLNGILLNLKYLKKGRNRLHLQRPFQKHPRKKRRITQSK